jgi:glucose-6-phosphate 1-epimerase
MAASFDRKEPILSADTHHAGTPHGDALADFPDALQRLPGLRLDAGAAGAAFVAAQGAQPLSWQGGDGRERLYLSPSSGGLLRGQWSAGDAGAAAIRGGMPVCFPQFSDRGALIKHGFARLLPWRLASRAGNAAVFALDSNAASAGHWPCAFHAELRVALAPGQLQVTLAVVNTGDAAWSFTAALHTYLRVEDIRSARLLGLAGVRYQDATDGCLVKTQDEPELEIAGEVDRVYLAPPPGLLLAEAGRPALRIGQHGFADTVVWNPGPQRARALADFPDEDWLRMLCVEAACAAAPVRLGPGQSWEGGQTLDLA